MSTYLFLYRPIARLIKPALLLLPTCLSASEIPQPTFMEGPSLGRAPTWEDAPVVAPSGRWNAPLTIPGPQGTVYPDTSKREEVRLYYQTVYKSSLNVATGWTGSYAGAGNPGTTTSDFKGAVLRRVNYYRAMAGVPPWVSFDTTFSAQAQQAALMMSGQNALSHTPGPNWAFYTQEGADAAVSSNLALGSMGPEAIDGYMVDYGAGNTRVGHRRWVLLPQTKVMGTGDVPGDGGQYREANALWVFDSHINDVRPQTRDGFIAWPPPGYIPYDLAPARWSFSRDGDQFPQADADFSSTTISVTQGGSPVANVQQLAADTGSGEKTLVFHVPGDVPNDDAQGPYWFRPTSDLTYSVTLNNVGILGVLQNVSYDVTLFDPELPGPGTVPPVVTGPDVLPVGVTGSFGIQAYETAEKGQYRTVALSPIGWTDGADNGELYGTLAGSPGYTRIRPIGGDNAFFFAHTSISTETFTIKASFLPTASMRVNFASRLGYATDSQKARVQVSTDDGGSWTTVWEQAGSNGPGESNFTAHAADLSAYAGQIIRVRFAYHFPGGSLFNGTQDSFGWAVDDISIDGSTANFGAPSAELDPMSFTYSQGNAATVGFQARAAHFGGYYEAWGPLTFITVRPHAQEPNGSEFVLPVYNGWEQTAWGWMQDHAYPWLGFALHGWLYYSAAESDPNGSAYFWDANLGWIYSSVALYPYFYQFYQNRWLFYQEPSMVPNRWFYNLDTGSWVRENTLWEP